MLFPLTSEIKRVTPTIYDLEWFPNTLVLRLVGVRDERGYRKYTSIPAFLAAEMTDENRGRMFFAHAGGSFDVQFILEEIAKHPEYSVTASFSGSSAVLVTVRRDKHKWTFADSFFLMRSGLDKIAITLGMKKGSCAFDAPLEELTPYNELDCEILYKAVLALQEELNELGGEMRATLASCAMNLFKRVHLKRKIATSAVINHTLREAYCASRVEVHRPRLAEGEYFDINSSFPYSMTKPQPGNLKRIRKDIPKGERAIYFAKVKVEVPPMDLPPLPYRAKGRIFFPHGHFGAARWLSKIDIDLLESVGGRVLSVERVYEYEPFDDLVSYVETIFALKNKADRAGDEFKRYLYKLLLNALYGKFAERSIKEAILIHPDRTTCPHAEGLCPKAGECFEIIAPGIWKFTDHKDVPHAHVPISTYVTAGSRELLYRGLEKCDKRAYCDTDSIMCGTQGAGLPVSDKLGDWKHEGHITDAHLVCAKVYSFTTACGTCKGSGCADCKSTGEKRVIRSKGFRRLKAEDFDSLVRFEPVPIERMAGIREGLIANGKLGAAWSKITQKRLSRKTIPKRKVEGELTRPWDVDELLERI